LVPFKKTEPTKNKGGETWEGVYRRGGEIEGGNRWAEKKTKTIHTKRKKYTNNGNNRGS
jgi:hypothetical protein